MPMFIAFHQIDTPMYQSQDAYHTHVLLHLHTTHTIKASLMDMLSKMVECNKKIFRQEDKELETLQDEVTRLSRECQP